MVDVMGKLGLGCLHTLLSLFGGDLTSAVGDDTWLAICATMIC